MRNEKLSIIIPIHNEAGNIIPLEKELRNEISKYFVNFEIIYINDGSDDNSLEELNSLENVVILNLNRKYGQAIAFDVGFRYATGDLILTLDGDGQNDPRDIKLFIEKLEKDNLDVVSGWRKDRKSKTSIRLLSKFGSFLRQKIINDVVHDPGCSFRIYKRRAVENLSLSGEMHRYIVSILR